MAHKKGQGSVRNGRDSRPQRRGVKKYTGQTVTTGTILVTQVGTPFKAGRNVKRARNDSLFALCDGTVYFDQGGRRVNILPLDYGWDEPLWPPVPAQESIGAVATKSRQISRSHGSHHPDRTQRFEGKKLEPNGLKSDGSAVVGFLYKAFLSGASVEVRPKKNDGLSVDTPIQVEDELHVQDRSFGVAVRKTPSGCVVLVPSPLWKLLSPRAATTARGLVALLRMSPSAVARGVGLPVVKVVAERANLVDDFRRHHVVDEPFLAEPASDSQQERGMGVLLPPVDVIVD